VNGIIFYDNAAAFRGGTTSVVVSASGNDGTYPVLVADENIQSYWQVDDSPGATWIKLDLGSVQLIRGWALLNSNIETIGVTAVTLKVGTADNGSTFDQTVDTLTVGSVSGCEPNVCSDYISGMISKRYWRVEFSNPATGLRVGEIMLFRGYLALPETPDAPFTEVFTGQSARGETERGHDLRSRRGGSLCETVLNWDCHGSTLKDSLDALAESQEDRYPFVYIDHQQTAASGFYPGCRCVYMPEGGAETTELSPGEKYRSSLDLMDVKTP